MAWSVDTIVWPGTENASSHSEFELRDSVAGVFA